MVSGVKRPVSWTLIKGVIIGSRHDKCNKMFSQIPYEWQSNTVPSQEDLSFHCPLSKVIKIVRWSGADELFLGSASHLNRKRKRSKSSLNYIGEGLISQSWHQPWRWLQQSSIQEVQGRILWVGKGDKYIFKPKCKFNTNQYHNHFFNVLFRTGLCFP